MPTNLSNKDRYTQSQKMMIFILSMSLFGLASLFTELLPEFQLGPIDISISYLAFIPLILVFLFHPLYAAIGASVGDIIFGKLLLGDFGGIAELEGFIEFSLAMYVAGLLVRDPSNRRQVGIAVIVGVGIDQMLSSIVDIGKVWFGIEELETVTGLPESILAIEAFSFVNEMVISGVLFGLIPTLYLLPKLYGKIEPLMGINPRNPDVKGSMLEYISARFVIVAVFLAFVGMVAEYMSDMDINFAVWEPDFLEQFGDGYIWIPISAAAIIVIFIISIAIKMGKKKDEKNKWAV
ncbi:cell division protein FtsQ [Sporosarcina thermotolerans]|uniref:Cell division protein FtsQ n=1 Tax=Sporosarcina thermotolerans TaxID=633404 RepID=A0AAW9ADQ6_9BACL|nr:cell division protein FtsQ [Sporosarcina thermotolerans]MDW0117771.1 cell division protein FtsQ [Sporosarcina thermotolerans]WHT49145.1 cell division protein FtsQ [Sporosarcina thermotolerans]